MTRQSARPRACLAMLALLTLSACASTGGPPVVSGAGPAVPAMTAEVTGNVLALARTAIAEDRHDDARRLLERVLLSDPENRDAVIMMADLRLAAGEHDRALAILDKVPGWEAAPAAMQVRGLALLRGGRKAEAAELLSRAVDGDSGLWRAWNALGVLHDAGQDWPAAEAAYAKALETAARPAPVLNNRGYSRLMQGRAADAVRDFRAALGHDAGLEEARANLRLALALEGRYEHALHGVEKPQRSQTLNNVGFMALSRGDLGTAERLLTEAVAQSPSYNQTASRNLDLVRSLRGGTTPGAASAAIAPVNDPGR